MTTDTAQKAIKLEKARLAERENDIAMHGFFTVIRRDLFIAKRNKYRRLNRHKLLAHAAVARAICSGDLVRPDSCSKCPKECIPDAHHWSYKPEHWLDVAWLCKSCHMKLHYAERQNKAQLIQDSADN